MSNGDAPGTGSPPPPPSNGGNQRKGCLGSLAPQSVVGDLFGETKIKWGDKEISAPLGILSAMLVACVLAYFVLMLWAIPKHVPILSDPLIEAALTAVPTPTPAPTPTPVSRVVVDKRPQSAYYCVYPGEKGINVRVDPTPSAPVSNYRWYIAGATLTEVAYWNRWFDVDEEMKPGENILVSVCENDVNKPCLGSINFVIAQVCPP